MGSTATTRQPNVYSAKIESNPDYAQAFVNLGVTLASESRWADAKTALQNAIRIDPANKEAQEILAKIQEEIE
jgi:cytochrome c-type biogenesis protein CcmH/NrfG